MNEVLNSKDGMKMDRRNVLEKNKRIGEVDQLEEIRLEARGLTITILLTETRHSGLS